MDQKFDAHSSLTRKLWAIEQLYLVETNPRDKVWEAGMALGSNRIMFVTTEMGRGGWKYQFRECNPLGRRLVYCEYTTKWTCNCETPLENVEYR